MTSHYIPAIGTKLLGMRAPAGLHPCTVVEREVDPQGYRSPRIVVEFADGGQQIYSGQGIADYTVPDRRPAAA